MSDLYHKDVPGYMHLGTMCAIFANPQHRFLVLTKRAERMRSTFEGVDPESMPENAWFGITCENQRLADKRWAEIKALPFHHRWISFEPQLELIQRVPIADWAVVGCESGPGRRFHDPEWARVIIQAYKDAGKPIFIKQLMIDGRCIHDWNKPDFPDEFKIRQLPWRVAA